MPPLLTICVGIIAFAALVWLARVGVIGAILEPFVASIEWAAHNPEATIGTTLAIGFIVFLAIMA